MKISNINDNNKASIRAKKRSQSARDIGEILPCTDLLLVQRMRYNLLLFLQTCFPQSLNINFDKNLIQYVKSIEQIILGNGLFKSVAIARSVGKSTIAQRAIIWGALYGHKSHQLLLFSSKLHQVDGIESIKGQLYTNKCLLQYFPQIIYPLTKLEQRSTKCKGQTYKGKPTLSQWNISSVTFPSISGADGAGSTIRVSSIESKLRGLNKFAAPKDGKKSGTAKRIDFCLIDDISTQQTAYSPSQNRKLLKIIQSSIMMLGSSTLPISILYIGTVIEKNDLTQIMIKMPGWRGICLPFLQKLPDNMQLWQKWKDILDPQQAYNYYINNKIQMQKGVISNFPSRVDIKTGSSTYFALLKWKQDQNSFYSQMQMQPRQRNSHGSANRLKQQQILQYIGQFPRGFVRPQEKTVVGMDINLKAMSYLVLAFSQTDKNVRICDYGYYPQQTRRHIKLDDIKNTINITYDGASMQQKFYKCLKSLMDMLQNKYQPVCFLADSNWFQSTNAVIKIMGQYRQEYKKPCYQAKGKGTKKYGDTIYMQPGKKDIMGNGWKITTTDGTVKVMHDPNYKKTYISNKFANGYISIYKDTQQNHLMLAQHMCSQYFQQISSLQKQFNQWHLTPGYDNHFWDCLVLCFNAMQIHEVLNKPKKIKPKKEKIEQPISLTPKNNIIQTNIYQPQVNKKKKGSFSWE